MAKVGRNGGSAYENARMFENGGGEIMDTIDRINNRIDIADKWLERNIWRIAIVVAAVVTVVEVGKSYWWRG